MRRRILIAGSTESTHSRLVTLDEPASQDLDVYWNPEMAQILETWGEGTAWHELKFLTAGLSGRILDIACGTGRNIEDLRRISQLDIHGCDISDFLIKKAVERGIPAEQLKVCDARRTGFDDNYFDHSYSIGSLEHFTDKGLEEVIAESYRITRLFSFHMIPVSSKDLDEGWIKTRQSYFCNSLGWWMKKFNTSYRSVTVVDSLWKGEFTVGKWFVCRKDESEV